MTFLDSFLLKPLKWLYVKQSQHQEEVVEKQQQQKQQQPITTTTTTTTTVQQEEVEEEGKRQQQQPQQQKTSTMMTTTTVPQDPPIMMTRMTNAETTTTPTEPSSSSTSSSRLFGRNSTNRGRHIGRSGSGIRRRAGGAGGGVGSSGGGASSPLLASASSASWFSTTTSSSAEAGGGGGVAVDAGEGFTAATTTTTTSTVHQQPPEEEQQTQTPATVPRISSIVPDPNEPDLYLFPDGLSPVYRPVPIWLNLCLGAMSLIVIQLVSNILVSRRRGLFQPLLDWIVFIQLRGTSSAGAGAGGQQQQLPWGKITWYIIRWFLVWFSVSTIIQDILYGPSRVTVQTLQQHYNLPSKLSRYETIRNVFCDDSKGKSNSSSPITTTTNNNNNNSNNSSSNSNRANNEDEEGQQGGDDDDDCDNGEEENSIGIHWLQYDNDDHHNRHHHHFRFDALYLNHGFGASSLSWLPCIRKLGQRLDCNMVLGHDAMGFGYTQRTNNIKHYRFVGSGQIGCRLLQIQLQGEKKKIQQQQQNEQQNQGQQQQLEDEQKQQSIIIMGHSMGALSTLHMSLRVDRSIRQRIILVCPALGLSPTPPNNEQQQGHQEGQTTSTSPGRQRQSRGRRRTNDHSNSSNNNNIVRPPSPTVTTTQRQRRRQQQQSSLSSYCRRLMTACTGVFIDAPFSYILRRIIGNRYINFWRLGLRSAWGDPSKVSNSDVLRFQWPSIGYGWEKGILTFTKAQTTSKRTLYYDEYNDDNDQDDTDYVANSNNINLDTSISDDDNNDDDPFLTDSELLQRVIDRPNVLSVDVIVASKDPVVNPKSIRKFLQDNNFIVPVGVSSSSSQQHDDDDNDIARVRVIELDGLGHDPFEEDVDTFVQAVEQLLSTSCE